MKTKTEKTAAPAAPAAVPAAPAAVPAAPAAVPAAPAAVPAAKDTLSLPLYNTLVVATDKQVKGFFTKAQALAKEPITLRDLIGKCMADATLTSKSEHRERETRVRIKDGFTRLGFFKAAPAAAPAAPAAAPAAPAAAPAAPAAAPAAPAKKGKDKKVA